MGVTGNLCLGTRNASTDLGGKKDQKIEWFVFTFLHFEYAYDQEKSSDHQRDQVLDILEKRLHGTHRVTAQETSTYTPYDSNHTNAAYEGSFLTGEEKNPWLSFELIPSFVLILAKSGDKILAK